MSDELSPLLQTPFREQDNIDSALVSDVRGENEPSSKQATDLVPLLHSYRKWFTVICTMSMVIAFATQSSMSSALVCMIPATQDNDTNDALLSYSSTFMVPGNRTDLESKWKFHWSKESQGWVLASFFIGYYVSQFPSGLAASMWGPKNVLVFGMLLASVVQGLAVPAAYYGLDFLYADRAVAGFLAGLLYPPTFALVGLWVPKQEIGLLFGIIGSGIEIGSMLAFLISTWACEIDFQGGWPIIFYTLAALGFMTMLAIAVFLSDSPFTNKYMSEEEKRSISGSVPKPGKRTGALRSIPMKSILKSMPVWSIAVSQIGSDWIYYFFTTVEPLYLKEVIKLSEMQTSLLSGVPFIFILPGIYVSGYLSDKIVSTGVISNTAMRKINDFLCKIVPGMALLGLGFVPEGSVGWVFLLNTVISLFMGFFYVSWMANPVDLAPAYTGTIVGFCESCAMWVAFVVPIVVEDITKDKTREQWRQTFYITAGLQVVTHIFYAIFASGDLQPWALSSYQYGYAEDDNDVDPSSGDEINDDNNGAGPSPKILSIFTPRQRSHTFQHSHRNAALTMVSEDENDHRHSMPVPQRLRSQSEIRHAL